MGSIHAREAIVDAITVRTLEVHPPTFQVRLVVEEDFVPPPFLCIICYASVPQLVFTCGHIACKACTEQLKVCHSCRRPIKIAAPIYL